MRNAGITGITGQEGVCPAGLPLPTGYNVHVPATAISGLTGYTGDSRRDRTNPDGRFPDIIGAKREFGAGMPFREGMGTDDCPAPVAGEDRDARVRDARCTP